MATMPINNDIPEVKDIQIYQPDAQVGELKLWRPPEKVLADARQAAIALQDVIRNSAIKPVKFGDKEHLLHEHWEILGHFFGYCTKVEWTKFVEYPDANGGSTRGFEASAVLLNERSGAVVGRAEAMCLDEEDNWGEVAEYEYQDRFDQQGRKVGRQRVEVGTKNKPLFQLRSMAQTRASAKCFRTKLAWIAVLAGYSQTPAEEIRPEDRKPAAREEIPSELRRKSEAVQPLTPSYEQRREIPPRPQPQPVSAPPHQNHQAPARPQAASATINDKQARRFYAIWKQAGKTKAMVKEYLQNTFGVDDDRQIPANRYQEACKWAEGNW